MFIGPGKCTPLKRSWKHTVRAGLMGLGLVVLGVFFLWETAHDRPGLPTLLGGILLLFFALLAFWTAVSASYAGECPTCGTPLKGIGGLQRCDNCLAYGEVKGNQYCQIELDRVSKTIVFSIILPDQWMMPKLCCACGGPYERVYKLRIIREDFAFDMSVPHCALHTRGAELTTEYRKNENKYVPVLKVASYSFYREFLKKNGLGKV